MGLSALDELTAGLKAIRKRGWYKGSVCDEETGAVCAIGALAVARGIDVESWLVERWNDDATFDDESHAEMVYYTTPGVKALARVIRRDHVRYDHPFKDDISVVWNFNDESQISQEQIEDVFRKAIENEKRA